MWIMHRLSNWKEHKRRLRLHNAHQELLRAADRIVISASTVQEKEHSLLNELVEEANRCPGPVIEIGTLFGFTTSRLAVSLVQGKRIITVDNYSWNPWCLSKEKHYELTANVLHYLKAVGKVEQIESGKNEFYREYSGESPAMVFLDAIHTYPETKADIEWARSANAAIIAGHDYSEEFPGVMQAVQEFGGPRKLCGTVWSL